MAAVQIQITREQYAALREACAPYRMIGEVTLLPDAREGFRLETRIPDPTFARTLEAILGGAQVEVMRRLCGGRSTVFAIVVKEE